MYLPEEGRKFLQRAIDPQCYREALRYMHLAHPQVVVASDGYRMHLLEFPERVEGVPVIPDWPTFDLETGPNPPTETLSVEVQPFALIPVVRALRDAKGTVQLCIGAHKNTERYMPLVYTAMGPAMGSAISSTTLANVPLFPSLILDLSGSVDGGRFAAQAIVQAKPLANPLSTDLPQEHLEPDLKDREYLLFTRPLSLNARFLYQALQGLSELLEWRRRPFQTVQLTIPAETQYDKHVRLTWVDERAKIKAKAILTPLRTT